ncbi:MAG: PLP-dependent aminotransferase family protein [Lachnospiraceae bacterium]|nr:PLP-dependent aminotransferase family protein [Lachnospiraceae bacterium]MEE1342166.1 PLP-dependent aminotransferase family protein [Lachnospiraceae bacterium]
MFTILIDSQKQIPIYQQIYEYIKEEIKNGNLVYQDKLPSSRGLASHIAVSRNTVDLAYSQLVSEGYIEARPKSGYYVCDMSQLVDIKTHPVDTVLEKEEKKQQYEYDFSFQGVDMNYFPYNRWRKLLKEVMINDNSDLFQIGHRQGDFEFRRAIKEYLHQSRGVNCSENQIMIGAGSDYLLMLLSRILGTNHKIAMENPTYLSSYRTLKELGFEIQPIEVKEKGMDIKQLEESDASLAYVTPSHQFPTGTVMPISRRIQLLSWARKGENRYIIEDDYDSEFRYLGKPIPALQNNDTEGKVIYIGTFSKAIAPAIRISYMVVPKELMKKAKATLSCYSCTVSRIDQAVLGRFLQEGYFERHINKMRKIYKTKHDRLVKALAIFGDDIRILGESAGLHLVIELKTQINEKRFEEECEKGSIKITAMKEFFIEPVKQESSKYLLGFARLREDKIEEAVEKLYRACYTCV